MGLAARPKWKTTPRAGSPDGWLTDARQGAYDRAMKYCIITYGCQMNLYDSGLIESLLEDFGLVKASSPQEADLILVNTCSVRGHAEERALGRINSLGRLKSASGNVLVGVVGCMAKRYGERLMQEAPCVDFVVGPDNYRSLPDLIKNRRRAVLIEETSEKYSCLRSRHRRGPCAFVAIMRGCGNYCAYCVVPYLRGPERSRAHEEILDEIAALAHDGVKEVTLLGQNVNSYDDGKIGFPGLLGEACKVTGIARIRFTTSHPKDVTSELLQVMGREQKICNWLHLPVQSGSNRVLDSMNRHYTREEYLDLVDLARDSVSGLAITTDIMVGFPGETEEDFGLTLDLVRRVRFDFAYMFMYSRREGTKAADFDDLPIDLRKRRLKQLIEIQNGVTRERNRELVGQKAEILVEGKCKKGDYDGYGKTGSNKVVLFKGIGRPGDCVVVDVRGLSGWTPWGEIVDG